MESKITKTSDLPFYKIARRLLRAKIDSPKKANKFYIDVNNFASEIASDEIFLDEISAKKYSNNTKLHESIIRILGYGKAIEEGKVFADSLSLQKVNIKFFLDGNQRRKTQIKIIQNEALLLFSTRIENFEEYENEKNKEESQKIREIRTSIATVDKIRRDSELDKEIIFEDIIYRDQDIYHNGKLMILPPQSVRLFRMFMMRKDQCIREYDIENNMSEKLLKPGSVGKAIHLLRKDLKEQNYTLPIKNYPKMGYKLRSNQKK